MSEPLRVLEDSRQPERQAKDRRIAIGQLERAELYLVALTSLGLDDPDAASVEDLLRQLRALRQRLLDQQLRRR
ncbi:MAG TPA: hypothetical protein VF134_07165 [Candidatus Dormibacteraeota bacterium]